MPSPHHRRLARDQAELVVRRAEFLPDRDRALLTAVYAQGWRIKDVAAVMREDPRRLSRRVRRLTRRILSNPYMCVVRHRDSWPAMRRRIATACIIHGRTIRQAAEDSQTSFYNARKQLEAVRAILDSIAGAPEGAADGAGQD